MERVCWIFLVFLTFLVVLAFPTKLISTDSEGKNWRKIQQSGQRRQKNRKVQRMKLLKLRKLNSGLTPAHREIEIFPHLFYTRFGEHAAVAVSKQEGSLQTKCSFLAADCSMELQEQEAVSQLITPHDVVLELGGRFGTTSCTISHYQKNSGKLVVVEPDPDVWNILARNQKLHFCNFWTFQGAVSYFPVKVSSAEYATRAISSSTKPKVPASNHSNEIPVSEILPLDLLSLQRKLGMYFTTLLIDCEGCIEQVLAVPPTDKSSKQEEYVEMLLRNVTKIIVETDMKENTPHCQSQCVNYQKWFNLFRKIGFRIVFQKQDSLFSFIDHVAFQR